MQTLTMHVDAQGIALITLNDPARPMNVVGPAFIDDFIEAIERVATDPSIVGAIVTSAKPAFMAGADLKHLMSLFDAGVSRQQAFALSRRASVEMHRRLETCGKPFVSAINGLALGGGFELCLACHWRVIVDDPKAVVGLPEVNVGLLAGSGGTQRLLRMIGVDKALPLLLDGKSVTPQEALALGMVDAVVPATELLPTARRWLIETPNPVRKWDTKNYRLPEGAGLLSSSLATTYSMNVAKVGAKTFHNYPAPIAILDCVFEGALMPFDKALTVESKHFARLMSGPVARNIVRTNFVNKGLADRLARRPEGVPKFDARKIGVLGAGMMGSGIAYVAALAAIDVVLLDATQEQAERGRDYSRKLLAGAVERGRRDQASADAILARITATSSYSALADCDLVIEAVFEDKSVKADVTRQAEAVLQKSAFFASNTSTLPISELARQSDRPERYIGLHFFSPVDRMPLVEIIVGKQTSETTVAQALDLVAQLRMTPIVVNDSRGFYTSRVFQTFIHEGMRMLEEGVEPALIENAARFAGMPVGPLAVLDEVSIELPWKIVMQSREALGDAYDLPCSYDVMRRMLDEFKRPGRRGGGGFYDYPEGSKKRLWSELKSAFPPVAPQPSVDEAGKRILYIQALETARCLEEGVLTHAADADIGSVLAWGFPSYTGGTLSLIDAVGLSTFIEECERMAAAYGPRFKPSAWLRERAIRGHLFHAVAGHASEAVA
ncbi:3-hydroxyacyl-CoA dehydrogenase NAD-binding domain-containing protein [Paraburkholderia caffeinilytica]|uniref:3-hydroxyacyl-CoA dehydrogenase NAD-binding domain-containing protein n=1 Tax=Paraburkholderia caffeinilytica TaxID=1761016 RepID=UPI003DA0865A